MGQTPFILRKDYYYFYFTLTFILVFLSDPSVDVTVITTHFPFPALLAIILPFLLTVTYFVLELVHFNVVLAGFPLVVTTALRFALSPIFKVFGAFFIFTPVTAFFIILKVIEANFSVPSVDFAVIVTFFPIPAVLQITTHFLLIVCWTVFGR